MKNEILLSAWGTKISSKQSRLLKHPVKLPGKVSIFQASNEQNFPQLFVLFFSSQQWRFYYVLLKAFTAKCKKGGEEEEVSARVNFFLSYLLSRRKVLYAVKKNKFLSFFLSSEHWERKLLCFEQNVHFIVNSFVFVMREGLKCFAQCFIHRRFGKLSFWTKFRRDLLDNEVTKHINKVLFFGEVVILSSSFLFQIVGQNVRSFPSISMISKKTKTSKFLQLV